MTGIPLFIAEPTATCRLSLRRFRYSNGDDHLHDAAVVIGEDEPCSPREADGITRPAEGRVPREDPRWPAACSCGESFNGGDEWQVNELDWYQGNGQRFAWGTGSWYGPAGAMIRAPWRDADGRPDAYVVFLPNGAMWSTNERMSGEGDGIGGYWQVTGTAPALTVHPSIDDRGSRPWHGWIRGGWLVTA